MKVEPFDIPEEYKHYKGKYKVRNMENSERVVKNVEIYINDDGEHSILKYIF